MADHLTDVTSPESRNTVYQPDKDARDRVIAADPNGGRCLIENVAATRAVQFCYCFARRFTKDDALMESLEWAWKMRNGTLNLDTRYNIFHGGAALHRMYDSHMLTLVPEDDIVTTYLEALVQGRALRRTFPEIPNGRFSYKLIPLQDMEQLPIFRQTELPQGNALPTPAQFSAFTFPFADLPLLTSHIHPKFVITATGHKASLLEPDHPVFTQYPILAQIYTIYTAWTAAPPFNSMRDDKTFWPPPKDHSDDDDVNNDSDYDNRSARTKKRRINRPKRAPASPLANRGQKRKCAGDLSERTLLDHTARVGDIGWSKAQISTWAGGLGVAATEGI